MILPATDYRAAHISAPEEPHKGLDRLAHALTGCYQRRSALLRNMQRESEQIIQKSLTLRNMSADRLRERLGNYRSCFRRRRTGYEKNITEALAVMAEVSERTLGLRPHPVQILGALALYRGYLAEMATGEGKSLTACFPAILSAWSGLPCHIITVNDYLAGRDADEMRPFYEFCGLSTGWVSSTMPTDERRIQYEAAVVYTTSKEIVADFLRDRIKLGACQDPTRRLISSMMQSRVRRSEGLVMRGLDTAIVDEADSVLIDEAVTPLIISHAQANEQLQQSCIIARDIADKLAAPLDYSLETKYREITLTKTGRTKIADLSSSLPGIWQGPSRREELVIQALTARELYKRDKQYVVQDGKVVIVDEFTGRLVPDRTWKHGLHQAVEAMEGLELSDPGETLARLSFQRFFRFFRKLSGMTGTAKEAAAEFWLIYGIPVMKIPSHKPCIRTYTSDGIYSDQQKKWEAIVDEIEIVHKTCRPVLVGTRNVKASARLAEFLSERGLKFNLLNAINHKEEATIIASAGKRGAITIATNMAGRGTDIKLAKGVAALGGLHVIATERHESLRIDRQLFGRCARQGDPGSAQAFMSMEDELLRRFIPAPFRQALSAALRKQAPGSRRAAEHLFSYTQKSAGRLAYRQRREVLEMDTWLAKALSFTGSGIEK